MSVEVRFPDPGIVFPDRHVAIVVLSADEFP